MKKLILCYLLSLTAIVCQAADIEINSLNDLKAFRDAVNSATNTYAGKTVALKCDLKLDAWEPIGLTDDDTHTFQGTFEGNGHTVIIDVNTSEAVAGFFGYLRGTVQHLKVVGSVVCTNTTTSAAGGIAGYNHGGTISECANLATIIGYICGGIAGENAAVGTISNCYNTGYIGSNGRATYLAGIAGKNNDGTIDHVYASCIVESISGSYAGITASGTATNAYYNVKTHTGSTLTGSETLMGTALDGRLNSSGVYTTWRFASSGLPELMDMYSNPVLLLNNGNNATTLSTYQMQNRKVQLIDRTLLKNGSWNTLCLPFSLTAEQIAVSPLADATIKTFTCATLTGDKLTLGFTDVTTIASGTPYLVKWTSGTAITNPQFDGVIISMDKPSSVSFSNGDVKFVGTFSPTLLAVDGTKLFVGSNNQLHYPSKADYYINSCRAYFDVNWSISSGARLEIILDDETTGIQGVKEVKGVYDDSWYTLQGRKVSNPVKGLYIVNGKKVAVK